MQFEVEGLGCRVADEGFEVQWRLDGVDSGQKVQCSAIWTGFAVAGNQI